MTFLLVCALCTSSPAPTFESHLEPPTAAPTLTADLGILPVSLAGPVLHLDQAEPSANHGGHGGESHMGPMWVVMGVMMVAMMATVGIVMMRRSNDRAQPTETGLAPGRDTAGIAFRFGTSGPGR